MTISKEDAEPKESAKKISRRERQLAAAKEIHEEWTEEYGHNGDAISDMAYRSHVMKLYRVMGQDENLVIELTQKRKQAGLEPLDPARLLFSGKNIREVFAKSQDDIVEMTLDNRQRAEKEALKKQQSRRI